MQDEVNEKTIALYIKTGKLTAQTLQKAMKAILSKGKKQLAKPPQGKQSLKQLMKQNAGVSNIEITEGNIKAFESTAKKYGIDFALKKDVRLHSDTSLSLFLTFARSAFLPCAASLRVESSFRIEGFFSCVSFFAENSLKAAVSTSASRPLKKTR